MKLLKREASGNGGHEVSRVHSCIYISNTGSRREVSVYRALGLADYNDACVKLKLADGEASITGKSLILKRFSEKEIIVEGEVTAINFG